MTTPSTLTAGELAAALRELGTGDSDDFKLFELCADNLPAILAALEDAERLATLRRMLTKDEDDLWLYCDPNEDGELRVVLQGNVGTDFVHYDEATLNGVLDTARRGEGR